MVRTTPFRHFDIGYFFLEILSYGTTLCLGSDLASAVISAFNNDKQLFFALLSAFQGRILLVFQKQSS